jgi:hypothetical protein
MVAANCISLNKIDDPKEMLRFVDIGFELAYKHHPSLESAIRR